MNLQPTVMPPGVGEVYALLALLADPKGFKAKLDELLTDTVAADVARQKLEAERATLEELKMQSAANVARAAELVEKAETLNAEASAKAANATADMASVVAAKEQSEREATVREARLNELAELIKKQDDSLVQRERDLLAKQREADDLWRTASALRAECDAREARLSAALGK